MNIVNFEHIDVSYDETIVLKDFSLQIKKGEHWAILGANGSGKTTLIKLISQELYPRFKKDQKKEIFGKSNWNIWELKQYMGIITSDLHYQFKKDASNSRGLEFIISGFYSSLGTYKFQTFSKEQIDKSYEIASFLEIEDLLEKKVGTMSTGQIRKCIIARALVHEPKALLLDEPTSGLDIKAQYNFIQTIRKLSSKINIILVTHHFDEIFDEISHICLLKNGEILKKGIKTEILDKKNLSLCFDFEINKF